MIGYAPALLPAGTLIGGDFRVVRLLAQGGMGAVYVVEQLSTQRSRALKVMLPQHLPDARSRERFVQEARVTARIESDHVLQVLDAGVDDATGMPWLAMELLQGEDLAAYVARRGPLAPDEALRIFRQLGHGVAAAHRAHLVHRDLKPENVFLALSHRHDSTFTVKVLDFGIAKVLLDTQTAARTTSTLGSPLWMAPEQIDAGQLMRPSTDVWALGLIAFWMLTGKVYWLAGNQPSVAITQLIAEIAFYPLETASARARALGVPTALPPGFDAWFASCVARAPGERFADADAMTRAFIDALGGDARGRDAQGTGPAPRVAPTQHGTPAAPLPSAAQPSAPQGPTSPAPPVTRAPAPATVALAAAPIALSAASATPRPRTSAARRALWIALTALVLGGGTLGALLLARRDAQDADGDGDGNAGATNSNSNTSTDANPSAPGTATPPGASLPAPAPSIPSTLSPPATDSPPGVNSISVPVVASIPPVAPPASVPASVPPAAPSVPALPVPPPQPPQPPQPQEPPVPDVAGAWTTDSGASGGSGYGRVMMHFTQRGSTVIGRYDSGRGSYRCTLHGPVCSGRWVGTTGEGWFRIAFTAGGDRFSGVWGYAGGADPPGTFTGFRRSR